MKTVDSAVRGNHSTHAQPSDLKDNVFPQDK